MNSRILVCLVSAMLATQMLLAQTGSRSIQGTITDSTAAVMPNATVALEHGQTANKFEG